MKISTALAASSLAVATTAQSNVTCVSGAHIIVARASGEDPGFGRLVTVKDEIISRIPDSDAVAIEYPASINRPVTYLRSVPQGVGNMTRLVKAYGDACPDRKMVLLGYSQGAQVVGDTVIGNTNGAFPRSPALDQKYIDQVAAIVLMGDPTNVPNQPFLVGNGTRNGTFYRRNVEEWAAKGLLNRTVSYCDADDTYCDSGTLGNYSNDVHGGYVPEYGAQAVQFVVEKFLYYNATGIDTPTNGSTTTTSAGPSATTTASSSRTPTGSPSATGPGNAATTTPPPNSASGLYVPSSLALVAAMALAMVL